MNLRRELWRYVTGRNGRNTTHIFTLVLILVLLWYAFVKRPHNHDSAGLDSELLIIHNRMATQTDGGINISAQKDFQHPRQTYLDANMKYSKNPSPFLRQDLVSMNVLPNFYTRELSQSQRVEYQQSTSIVYVHIPKSAGTTTNRCLESLAKQKKLKEPSHVWMRNYNSFFQSLSSGNHLRNKLYFGVFSMGVCSYINFPCSYFTILRDPIERAVSSYLYCQRRQGDKICQAADATKLTAKEWTLVQGSVTFYQLLHDPQLCEQRHHMKEADKIITRKGIVRKKGIESPCWFKQILLIENKLDNEQKEEILNFIISNLENWFSVIGLTDRYDETLQLLERVYDLPFHSVCAGSIENKAVEPQGDTKTNKESAVDKLILELQNDPDVRKALYEDQQIYNEGVRIFQKQLTKFAKVKSQREH